MVAELIGVSFSLRQSGTRLASLGGSRQAPSDARRHLVEPAREAPGIERLFDVLHTEVFPGRQLPNEEIGIAYPQASKRVAAGLQSMDDPAWLDVELQVIEHGVLDDGVAAPGGIDRIGGIHGAGIYFEGIVLPISRIHHVDHVHIIEADANMIRWE